MKRYGYLFDKIWDLENINLADKNARKGKHRLEIKFHDLRENDNIKLSKKIKSGNYKTSRYQTFKIYEPKERVIYKLPYYPDRITHHAIVNVLGPIWTKMFIANTYANIKHRGIKLAVNDVKKALRDRYNTKYCLKVDIRKYYPSINHDVLYNIISKKIKDQNVLVLLKEIIYSTDGLPIGNYLSQYFANLYLNELDHKIKEVWRTKYYFRYADDMIFLSSNKNELHNILYCLIEELKLLKLELKSNYQIFPVEVRGIDFLGYRFFHNKTKLRKSIRNRIFRKIYKHKNIAYDSLKRKLSSYKGWLLLCDSNELINEIKYAWSKNI